MIKKLLLCIYTSLLLACSASNPVSVVEAPDFKVQNLASFKVDPMRFGETHASSEKIMLESTLVSSQLRQGLISKGYTSIDTAKANFRINLNLVAMSESILADEKMEFMEGVRGSNFPSANPRARTYNSDVLQIEVREELSSSIVLTYACRLNDGEIQNAVISDEQIMNCLKILLEKFPAYKP